MSPPSFRPIRGTARLGAALIGIGALQFVAAMIVVQTQYRGYSDLANYISDLGNTATSPWHAVFNVSIAVLGVLSFVGILLAWTAFPRGGSRIVGLPLLLLASVAAVLVGIFPENVNPPVHDLVSLLVFAPGGIALLILAVGMRSGTGWEGGRAYSALLGLVTLVSLAYYVPTQANNSTFDPGLIERFIVAPILIWGFGVAVHVTRLRPLPRFSLGNET
ncbi:MAG: DUF998 domain-containing protein [Thermoplasmata archaeon]